MKLRCSSKSFYWLLFIVVITVLGVYSIKTIRLQTELFPIFPQDLPAVRGLKLLQNHFASSQEVFIAIESELDSEKLASVKRSLSELPDVASVKLLGQFDADVLLKGFIWYVIHLPPDQFAAFCQRCSMPNLEKGLIQEQAGLKGAIDPERIMRFRMDPFGLIRWLEVNTGFNPPFPKTIPEPLKGNIKGSILVVKSRLNLARFDECQSFIKQIRKALKQSSYPSGSVLITGGPAFVAETSIQMERDMYRMFTIAVVLVCLAFLIFYRSFVPLFAIMFVQVAALLFGIVMARWIFKELNVLSMAFGVILLGVSMDYCILVYHFFSSGHHEDEWKIIKKGIWFSSATTAASFCILVFSSFPGLKQLSILVGFGLLSTAVMSTELLPLFFKKQIFKTAPWLTRFSDGMAGVLSRNRYYVRLLFTALIVIATGIIGFAHFEYFDPNLDKLQPAHSEAYQGMKLVMAHVGNKSEPLSVILQGPSWSSLKSKVEAIKDQLPEMDRTSLFLVPTADTVDTNKEVARFPSPQVVPGLLKSHGVKTQNGEMTIGLLSQLDAWKQDQLNFSDIETLARTVSWSDGRTYEVILKVPVSSNQQVETTWSHVKSIIPDAVPANWNLMAKELNHTVLLDFQRLSLWMGAAVLFLCWLAHRSLYLVALNILALTGALLGFLLLLWITGQSMTILSLLSVPLLIGLIIDYSIHILFGLEASRGELKSTYRHLAVPVILTGLTSLIGFGSPIASTQPSLQNFGMVMDLGIVAAVVSGLIFMPSFYRASGKASLTHSSSRMLYRSSIFSIALFTVRLIGRKAARSLGSAIGWLYALTHPKATRHVETNLQLVMAGRVNKSHVTQVFTNYGKALADYFCLGIFSNEEAFKWTEECIGFGRLERVREEGKGGILVTLHMGLFEYGNILMNHFHHETAVLTRPEPSQALTNWRAQYRKKWNSDTVEIGEDAFGFLNVLQELKKNRIVAALIDRPNSDRKILVDLPNGKIAFSTGPILLAIVAGCPIIPAIVTCNSNGSYHAEIFQPFTPVWRPEGRELTLQYYTDELARVFVPLICKNSNQWFHFVPLAC